MAIETKPGLSMSDFGEIIREIWAPDGKFSYALIRYGSGVCLINSPQWFEIFKNATVVPGSVTIELNHIVKYEVDDKGARVIGDDGNPKLIKTERTGWQVVAAKGLHQLQNESKTATEVKLLNVKEKTAVLEAENAYNRALKVAQEHLDLTPELRMEIEKVMQLDT